jgi:anaerobic sulfite reductase subunit C
MEWSEEAEEAVGKVPFFVRKRVKKRVEEEAVCQGAKTVTREHVKICQKRFLKQMEDEVRGFQVEICFGSTGCPNRAVAYDDFSKRVEELLAAKNFKSFLKEKVQGSLKMHHEFRVSISDCPNACSRPQIADLGLIGARSPQISNEPCLRCAACVENCREGAIVLAGKWPVLNRDKCLSCGSCLSACPTRTLEEEKRGYRIQVGGKLGRRPRLARELPGIHPPEEALKIVEKCVEYYQSHCLKGERFGEILGREKDFTTELTESTEKKRKIES